MRATRNTSDLFRLRAAEAAAVAHRTVEMRDGLVVSQGHLALREA